VPRADQEDHQRHEAEVDIGDAAVVDTIATQTEPATPAMSRWLQRAVHINSAATDAEMTKIHRVVVPVVSGVEWSGHASQRGEAPWGVLIVEHRVPRHLDPRNHRAQRHDDPSSSRRRSPRC